MTVMAIDPSLSALCTAIAVPGQDIQLHTSASKPLGKNATPAQRMRRYEELVEDAVSDAIEHHPKTCLVEGYSFNSKGRGIMDRAEMRAVLYQALLPHVGELVEVPPAMLKKFATGKGNAPKALVVSELTKRYQRTFESDDQADAYGLAMLGLVSVGREAARTKNQARVAAELNKMRDACFKLA